MVDMDDLTAVVYPVGERAVSENSARGRAETARAVS